MTKLSEDVFVRPQILPHEVEEIARAGFKGIINNRPDGEAPDQPTSDEIAAQAERHGLFYVHIPIVPGSATEANARAFAEAVKQAGGPVVAYCKSGGRASSLFQMTKRS
ncbi:TIGR01244 family sulfur transferase [Sphingomonas xanthus]|nr:TIGR01244 family sulfur transferase [Sphingomonas xanthus]